MSDNIPVLTKGYFVIFLIIFRQTTGITFPISEFLHFLVYYYRTAHYWKFTLFLCTVNYLQKQISHQLYIIRFDEDIAKKLGAPIFFFFFKYCIQPIFTDFSPFWFHLFGANRFSKRTAQFPFDDSSESAFLPPTVTKSDSCSSACNVSRWRLRFVFVLGLENERARSVNENLIDKHDDR